MNKLLVLITVIFFGISCDKGIKSPEGLLAKYIEEVTSNGISKDDYANYTTGNLWNSVKDLESEDFKNFILKNKVKSPKMKVLNKNCTGSKCILTYVVSYKNIGEATYSSEVKKVATIENIEDQGWRISDVTNIKTYLETQKPLEITK